MQTSEEHLARAAANGDADAFAALADRVYDRTFRLAFRLTGVRAEAEDLCHDVLTALPAKLDRFDGRSRFSTWLHRVVVNAAHDRRRRLQSRARAALGWGDAELHRRAETAEMAERTAWLVDAMTTLPPDLRDTLVLVLDGATHAEAGRALGISEGTVSWRISEVRKLLRAIHMKDAEPE